MPTVYVYSQSVPQFQDSSSTDKAAAALWLLSCSVAIAVTLVLPTVLYAQVPLDASNASLDSISTRLPAPDVWTTANNAQVPLSVTNANTVILSTTELAKTLVTTPSSFSTDSQSLVLPDAATASSSLTL